MKPAFGVPGSKTSPLPNSDPILNRLRSGSLLPVKNKLLQAQFPLLSGLVR